MRCEWVDSDLDMIDYHDKEWGKPVYDVQKLFEMLCLEGMQAGLSWKTVLKKRDFYRQAFYDFDIEKVAMMHEKQIDHLMQNKNLIRNRLKLLSIINNARAWQQLSQKQSMVDALWQFVDHKTQVGDYAVYHDIPSATHVSKSMSIWLKKNGFKFVGEVICYAFMQAVGMVNNHTRKCYLYHCKA
ncbi:DNA-3-methyladenine glycosylase I [Facilibium subflavum]|uniref:DNA-3-methyladenine glycosylase I n=1 Tax=Facilibium subflavum TaxID=2219058 RepID=UPI001F1F8B60